MTLPGKYEFLKPEMGADRAMRAILLQLLEGMESNLPGTIDNLDTEFLHDFRVAIRRTRSALAQVKQVFPEDEIRSFRERFRWLAGLTGPTRDLDVFLQKLPSYRESLSPDVASDLDPLLDFLRKHHREEQKELAHNLATDKVCSLLVDWRRYLEEKPDVALQAIHAATPILQVARSRIRKLYRRFLKEGRAITAESPDARLHRLRIAGKKLRYLLEFFQSLFPPREVRSLIKTTRAMQDFLGDFNDLVVQQQKLQEFGRRLQAELNAPADTLMAMGRLVESLARRQETMRLEFPERFAAFDRGKLRRRFDKLFPKDKG